MALSKIKFLFCFNFLTAKSIEICIIVLSTIGVIISILGIVIIPWKNTSTPMIVLYIISLVFLILSLGISLGIFCLRKKDRLLINTKKYLIYILIFLMFIIFFSFIVNIVIAIGTIPDLSKTVKQTKTEVVEETGEIKNSSIKEIRMTSMEKEIISIIFIMINVVISFLLIFLWISEYARIILNIDCSYYDFELQLKDNKLKNPTQYGLTPVGHNKHGFVNYGQQIGNEIVITKIGPLFSEKKKNNISPKYIEEDGRINLNIYSSTKERTETKEETDKKFQEKEKYFEKYYNNNYNNENIYQDYLNFNNRTIVNQDNADNSINPGYEI